MTLYTKHRTAANKSQTEIHSHSSYISWCIRDSVVSKVPRLRFLAGQGVCYSPKNETSSVAHAGGTEGSLLGIKWPEREGGQAGIMHVKPYLNFYPTLRIS